MNIIETTALTRTFRHVEAVRGLDLAVPQGSVFALIGPNGAGKTTTITLLMNLLQPSSGHARVLGVDSRALDVPELQRIGYVSENQALPDWMTTDQFLDYCRPFYPAWDPDLVNDVKRQLGLSSPQKIRALSRGMRMKTALLAALSYRPELLLLDEPFSGLDPLVRDELIHALLHVSNERPWTVVVSSHDVDEVERLCDWVGFMMDGRLILAEPVDTLLRRCRLVEVIATNGKVPSLPANAAWIPQGAAGRTLRFVDTGHLDDDADARLRAAFPGSALSIAPLTLREIFVALARTSASMEVA
jgi:ABC-2 type transport system ATP-binding protein